MRVRINKEYKSLISNKEFELPDFCILTGKNGSGKSHLLSSFVQDNIRDIYLRSYKNRVFIVLPIMIIFSLVYWYYLSIFGNIYPNSQICLLVSTGISIALNFGIVFSISFLILLQDTLLTI